MRDCKDSICSVLSALMPFMPFSFPFTIAFMNPGLSVLYLFLFFHSAIKFPDFKPPVPAWRLERITVKKLHVGCEVIHMSWNACLLLSVQYAVRLSCYG